MYAQNYFYDEVGNVSYKCLPVARGQRISQATIRTKLLCLLAEVTESLLSEGEISVEIVYVQGDYIEPSYIRYYDRMACVNYALEGQKTSATG